jgi:hypothetical protein
VWSGGWGEDRRIDFPADVERMSSLQIEVWDATGNKRQTVEVPAEAEVARVIAVLVDKMNLPRHSPDGQLMSYKFHHRGPGRQLLEEETLSQAGVQSGDVLRLQPEITAGACGGRGGPPGGAPTRDVPGVPHGAS